MPNLRLALHDAIPLYFRLYVALEQKILAGEWPEGRPLPSEQELAAQYKVSRVTVRNTMELLKNAALVVRHRGRGTFVNMVTLRKRGQPNFSGLSENSRDFEATTAIVLHEFGEVDVPEEVSQLLNGAMSGRALRIVRTRHTKAGPFSYSICYVSQPEAASLDKNELGNLTVLTLLERKGFLASRALQRLTSRAATPEMAGRLGIETGEPLICMKRAVYDRQERLIEYIETFYRPDKFEYRVELSRERGGERPPRWVQAN
ncbi:MAG TPA: GntR family transcriptional regulator [Bordetella sp.]